MKRKINRVGKNTLTISIPTKWAKKHNLKTGMELEINDKGKELSISTTKNIEEKETNITINEINYVRTIIGALYRKGYNKITINYPEEKIFKKIKKSVDNLIGYEIISQERGRCTIKSLPIPEENYEKTLNKLINLIKATQNIIKEDIKRKKLDNEENIEEYRQTAWKLRDYLTRLTVMNKETYEKTFAQVSIIWGLEKIMKEYRKMYPKIKTNNQLFDEITKHFDNFAKAITKKEQNINLLNKKSEELIAKCEKNINKDQTNIKLLQITERIKETTSYILINSVN